MVLCDFLPLDWKCGNRPLQVSGLVESRNTWKRNGLVRKESH
jgi:hypothetical protein